MSPGSPALDDFNEPTRLSGSPGADSWPASDPPARPYVVRERRDAQAGYLPEVGANFLGFRLVSELGRGAFARVFVARQGELADRSVVLKVSADAVGESQTLAQLLHTNIVPVYSVHRAPPFQAVCMPYLGATTLAHVLAGLRAEPAPPVTGGDLVRRLVRRPAGPTARRPGSTAILDMLHRVSYVEAVLWVAGRLADGLAHAHERGILHRDLKPANVLLTDEGQPMLLDFNLAEDVKARGRGRDALVGGTLPYMAPEQLEAFRGEARDLDARADLYSLGVILFELLARQAPFSAHAGPAREALPAMIADRIQGPPRLRPRHPGVPPAVESIVRHLLEPDPERRYPSARALLEDLERQRAHLPLKHAPNPSPRERAAKWLRRHPRLASAAGVAAGAVVLVLLAAVMWRG